ncbi:MAG: histidine kinase [Proteobacteria bacterium]|nr:histidine kinase [Pseudomonadota bacterium]
MKNEYQNLPYRFLSSRTLITQNSRGKAVKAGLDDPAFSMMTDFKHVRPFSTTTTTTIDEISQKMIACGVRLLFVAGNNDALLGLVTYNDIFGEKPVRYLQENGGKREEIGAQEIMTPLARLEALELDDILKVRIGDIVETMQSSGRQHILVVKDQADGSQAISGLFSSTQIENRLNIKIELSPRANTFADLERALNE